MYHTPADGNNNISQWDEWAPPGIPNGGAVYEVFIRIPSTNATSWQAPYVIVHANGANVETSVGAVDQFGLSNQWVSIGAYHMKPNHYVWTHDASGEASNQHCSGGYCKLAVDAVKFVRRGTIYLPDIRYNNGGWSSTLVLRNNGGGQTRTVVRWLKSDGSVTCNTHVTLDAHRSISLSCSDSQVASAVVDSSQDLSAVVRTSNSANTVGRLDNGYRPGSTGDVAFERPATTLYAPAFYRAIFGNMNSTLDIMNVSAQAANVTLEFKGRSGYADYTSPTYSLPAQGRLRIDASAVPFAPWVGSVKITSSQPVAASAFESTAGMVRSYSSAAGGHAMIFTPAGYKNVWNLTTGFVVQNLGTAATDITFTFCERLVTNPLACPTHIIAGVQPLRAVGLYLANTSVIPPMAGSGRPRSPAAATRRHWPPSSTMT